MASPALAACAVQGNSIYLYYHSDIRPSTKPFFVLSPLPFSSSSGSNAGSPTAPSRSISPYIPSSLSQTNNYGQDDTTTSKSDDEKALATVNDIGPTPNSGNGSGVLYYQLLTISNSDPSLRGFRSQSSSLSMATTSSFDDLTGNNRHGLLLAFNQVSPTLPLLVRLTPQSPAIGSGQNSFVDSTWAFNTVQQPMTPFGTQLRLAASASAPEGSTVYQLFTTQVSPVLQLGRYDVAGEVVSRLSGDIPIQGDGNPVMIKVTNSSGLDVAIIGVSSVILSPSSTVIQFVNSTGLSYEMTIRGTPYDALACYTSANGQIIKAKEYSIETITYDLFSPPSNWASRLSSKSLLLPSPILACTTIGNTLYTVLEGDSDGMPKVFTADMTSNNDWSWHERRLYNSDNGSSGRGDGTVGDISMDRNGGNSGLSSGAMVGIVVIAIGVVVLGGVAFWFLRRRQRAAKDLKALNGRVDKVTVRPPPPGTGVVPGQLQQGYSATYAVGPPPPPPPPSGFVSMSPQLSYHQQVPSSAAGWTTAVYPPSSRPGEHIPMVASSLTTAPPAPLNHSNMMCSSAASSIPSTPVYSPTMVGDKQELTSEDTTILPASSAVGYHQRPSTAMSHNSHQGGSSNTLLGAASPSSARSDSRMQEMFSPALANAQLILQRSQSPPNQTYQELQQPYHR